MKKKIAKYVCEHWINTSKMKSEALYWLGIGEDINKLHQLTLELMDENKQLKQSLSDIQINTTQEATPISEQPKKKRYYKKKKAE